MKVSVAVPQGIGADLVDFARRAESLGFHGLYCFDHLVPVSDPSRPAMEAAASLGAVAGATDRIVIGSLVLRATLRPPGITAGMAATLQAIAPGRVVIGLGAGDRTTRPEVARFGLPFPSLSERVAILEESVVAVQGEGVAAWVGGSHRDVVEVARRSDGWNRWEPSPDDRFESIGWTSWGGRVAPLGGRPDLDLDGSDVATGLDALARVGYDEVIASVVPVLDPEALERFAAIAATSID